VARRLLEMIEKEFDPATWRAFQRLALEGAKPLAVAAELGLSVNAVYLAKYRVLRRLRQEVQGLTD
jgi:RNA polymerase sigma-70 factor (ECF subfamily)